VRVLVDGNLPGDFAQYLKGYQAESVHSLGWSDLSNGDLLRVASGKFDALVTLDQNLPFQQNLRAFDIAIVLIRARSNRLIDHEPLVPELLITLAKAPRGEVTRVGA
jgi:hypothetical protein